MRLLLAPLALAGPAGYVNRTPGAEVALQLPGMHRAEVRRDLVYAKGRRLDAYRPPGTARALPAVPDATAINSSIDRFVAKSRRLGARVELLVHARGRHGFDATSDARSRAIVRRTLAFLRAHLQR
jgi:hypothetical protein